MVPGRSARCAIDRGLDPIEQVGRRPDLGGVEQRREPLVPERDLLRQRRIGGGVALDRVALLRAQQAEHVFGRAIVVGVAHGALSRQARRLRQALADRGLHGFGSKR